MRESKPLIYVPICPDSRLGGPVGYRRVERVSECPIIVSKKEYFAMVKLLSVSRARKILQCKRNQIRATEDMDCLSGEDERLECAIEVILKHNEELERCIASANVLLVRNLFS